MKLLTYALQNSLYKNLRQLTGHYPLCTPFLPQLHYRNSNVDKKDSSSDTFRNFQNDWFTEHQWVAWSEASVNVFLGNLLLFNDYFSY